MGDADDEGRDPPAPEGDPTTFFRTLLEASIDGILVVGNDREYLTYNQRFLDMWGVSAGLIEDEPEATALEWVTYQLEDPERFIEQVEYLYDHPNEESRDRVHLADGRVFDRYSAPVRAADGTHYGRVWFFRDVTNREETLQELERQNDRLEEFASVVSHDLRNPLNVAKGRLELAREAVDSEHLDAVARAHERMEELIEDLLTLARQGEQLEELEAVALARAVEACWEHVETTDAELRVETSATIMADRERLAQLLENLVRNAVQHGGDDVTVTVGDLEGGFFIEDDGPGIPIGDRDRVFDTGYSTETGGTGFGLSIVSTIVQAHGWRMTLTDGEAGGARFEITGVQFAG